ncbi:EF-P 5-aminopentanol modification-associated protein YfmF [Caldanaerobius polysaccharolyticus]|uniref:EF-P 5-aminopentanol modification-associated protein YfmF n=1 Tax=Caldanaerobius polysaccharolyticus TaxID=44256 RepID=UPI000B010B40|nr:pitrilysin family protein [Caldanaerobius polysaccharolyticus]
MKIAEGVNLYVDRINKFKTTSINVYVHEELGDNASKFALIPSVLKRGCNGYPTYRDITRYLEGLYGASLRVGVGKKGERQFIQFNMEVVDGRYAGEDTFTKAVDFICRILTQPVLENGHFKKSYVDIEKQNQVNQIKSRINDKTAYAVERCFEEMCKGEKFAIDRLGTQEMTQAIDEKNLYDYYRDVLASNPIDIIVTGDVGEDEVEAIVRNAFNFAREGVKPIAPTAVVHYVDRVKEVVDRLDVTQGKLSLGFRTNVLPDSPDYFKLVVYTGILGGGPHSKLFANVREKASLAYYAFARLERYKGLMVISSGIDVDNYHKALDIINQQLEDIKAGRISNYEYESTIKAIENSVKSMTDSAFQRADFVLSESIVGTNYSFDEYLQRVRSVTISDVVDVARRIQLDTIYFMRNKEGAK